MKTVLIVAGILLGVSMLFCGGCLGLAVIMAPDETTSTTVGERIETATPANAAPAASLATPTAANYARLQNGMTFDEVVAIVGQPTEELSRNQIGDLETVMYQWTAGFANMNAMFQGGRMIQKAQFGLK
jgi:hypothetical protein